MHIHLLGILTNLVAHEVVRNPQQSGEEQIHWCGTTEIWALLPGIAAVRHKHLNALAVLGLTCGEQIYHFLSPSHCPSWLVITSHVFV